MQNALTKVTAATEIAVFLGDLCALCEITLLVTPDGAA
jgi:hypothetical protein